MAGFSFALIPPAFRDTVRDILKARFPAVA